MAETITAREISITRVFDAPRELVWRAWTEPERIAQLVGQARLEHAASPRSRWTSGPAASSA